MPGLLPLFLLLFADVQVAGVPAPDAVELADGRRIRLYGCDTPALAPEQLAQVAELARGKWEATELSEWRPAPDGGTEAGYAPAWWLERDGRSLSVELVSRGLAVAQVTSREGHHAEALQAAARRAMADGRGVWKDLRRPPADTAGRPTAELPLPAPRARMAGVAFGLRDEDAAYTYERELREVEALGATWVNLLVGTWQDRVDSSYVPPCGSRALPSPEVLERAVRQAREVGLEVLVLPIVLIRDPGPDDWRGALRPADRDTWWQSYNAYIVELADVAARAGARAFCVGSELASMERDTAAWERVILNVRCRFPGYLTYSANWDHFAELEFWERLDLAGMNAYFELTTDLRAPPDKLRAGWRRAREEIERLARRARRPVILTEVGIPSVEGGVCTPWDYTRVARNDPRAQARGFEAFEAVFLPPDDPPAPVLHGLFLYDWWGEGGPADIGYTARGKPAEEVWGRLLRRLR